MMITNLRDNLDYYIPNPKCELDYNKDYELLLSVMLSAQTTDKRVNEVTKELYKYNLNEIASLDVKIIEDNKINKISNSNYTYYLVNIKDMIYYIEDKNESIYDLMNTENANDYIFSLVKVSYFSNDKIMTAYSGKYFDVINCSSATEYYIVCKDYEYDEMFCKNY